MRTQIIVVDVQCDLLQFSREYGGLCILSFYSTAIFERLRNILHEGQIEMRVQYMVEVMFAVRKDKFKVCCP